MNEAARESNLFFVAVVIDNDDSYLDTWRDIDRVFNWKLRVLFCRDKYNQFYI